MGGVDGMAERTAAAPSPPPPVAGAPGRCTAVPLHGPGSRTDRPCSAPEWRNLVAGSTENGELDSGVAAVPAQVAAAVATAVAVGEGLEGVPTIRALSPAPNRIAGAGRDCDGETSGGGGGSSAAFAAAAVQYPVGSVGVGGGFNAGVAGGRVVVGRTTGRPPHLRASSLTSLMGGQGHQSPRPSAAASRGSQPSISASAAWPSPTPPTETSPRAPQVPLPQQVPSGQCYHSYQQQQHEPLALCAVGTSVRVSVSQEAPSRAPSASQEALVRRGTEDGGGAGGSGAGGSIAATEPRHVTGWASSPQAPPPRKPALPPEARASSAAAARAAAATAAAATAAGDAATQVDRTAAARRRRPSSLRPVGSGQPLDHHLQRVRRAASADGSGASSASHTDEAASPAGPQPRRARISSAGAAAHCDAGVEEASRPTARVRKKISAVGPSGGGGGGDGGGGGGKAGAGAAPASHGCPAPSSTGAKPGVRGKASNKASSSPGNGKAAKPAKRGSSAMKSAAGGSRVQAPAGSDRAPAGSACTEAAWTTTAAAAGPALAAAAVATTTGAAVAGVPTEDCRTSAVCGAVGLLQRRVAPDLSVIPEETGSASGSVCLRGSGSQQASPRAEPGAADAKEHVHRAKASAASGCGILAPYLVPETSASAAGTHRTRARRGTPRELDSGMFKLGRILGSGSFATVYLAKQVDTGAKVVVKRLDRRPPGSRAAQSEAENEVAILTRAGSHPNLVEFRGWYRDPRDGVICLVMGYCGDGTLAQLIKNPPASEPGRGPGGGGGAGGEVAGAFGTTIVSGGGAVPGSSAALDGGALEADALAAAALQRASYFSEDQVMFWFVQLLLALHHLHGRKIMHRDLKPDNIFLAGNRRVIKLGDLGVAKQLEGTFELAITCLGTPYYMSPECLASRPYTYASDIWSLGCVLYEMAARRTAFEALGLPQLMFKILRVAYDPLPTQFTRPFQQLVNSMLRADPEDRPTTQDLLSHPFVRRHLKRLLDISARKVATAGQPDRPSAMPPKVKPSEARSAVKRLERACGGKKRRAANATTAAIDDLAGGLRPFSTGGAGGANAVGARLNSPRGFGGTAATGPAGGGSGGGAGGAPRSKNMLQWDSGARYEARRQQQVEMRFRAREFEQRITREQVRQHRRERDPAVRAREAELEALRQELLARRERKQAQVAEQEILGVRLTDPNLALGDELAAFRTRNRLRRSRPGPTSPGAAEDAAEQLLPGPLSSGLDGGDSEEVDGRYYQDEYDLGVDITEEYGFAYTQGNEDDEQYDEENQYDGNAAVSTRPAGGAAQAGGDVPGDDGDEVAGVRGEALPGGKAAGAGTTSPVVAEVVADAQAVMAAGAELSLVSDIGRELMDQALIDSLAEEERQRAMLNGSAEWHEAMTSLAGRELYATTSSSGRAAITGKSATSALPTTPTAATVANEPTDSIRAPVRPAALWSSGPGSCKDDSTAGDASVVHPGAGGPSTADKGSGQQPHWEEQAQSLPQRHPGQRAEEEEVEEQLPTQATELRVGQARGELQPLEEVHEEQQADQAAPVDVEGTLNAEVLLEALDPVDSAMARTWGTAQIAKLSSGMAEESGDIGGNHDGDGWASAVMDTTSATLASQPAAPAPDMVPLQRSTTTVRSRVEGATDECLLHINDGGAAEGMLGFGGDSGGEGCSRPSSAGTALASGPLSVSPLPQPSGTALVAPDPADIISQQPSDVGPFATAGAPAVVHGSAAAPRGSAVNADLAGHGRSVLETMVSEPSSLSSAIGDDYDDDEDDDGESEQEADEEEDDDEEDEEDEDDSEDDDEEESEVEDSEDQEEEEEEEEEEDLAEDVVEEEFAAGEVLLDEEEKVLLAASERREVAESDHLDATAPAGAEPSSAAATQPQSAAPLRSLGFTLPRPDPSSGLTASEEASDQGASDGAQGSGGAAAPVHLRESMRLQLDKAAAYNPRNGSQSRRRSVSMRASLGSSATMERCTRQQKLQVRARSARQGCGPLPDQQMLARSFHDLEQELRAVWDEKDEGAMRRVMDRIWSLTLLQQGGEAEEDENDAGDGDGDGPASDAAAQGLEPSVEIPPEEAMSPEPPPPPPQRAPSSSSSSLRTDTGTSSSLSFGAAVEGGISAAASLTHPPPPPLDSLAEEPVEAVDGSGADLQGVEKKDEAPFLDSGTGSGLAADDGKEGEISPRADSHLLQPILDIPRQLPRGLNPPYRFTSPPTSPSLAAAPLPAPLPPPLSLSPPGGAEFSSPDRLRHLRLTSQSQTAVAGGGSSGSSGSAAAVAIFRPSLDWSHVGEEVDLSGLMAAGVAVAMVSATESTRRRMGPSDPLMAMSVMAPGGGGGIRGLAPLRTTRNSNSSCSTAAAAAATGTAADTETCTPGASPPRLPPQSPPLHPLQLQGASAAVLYGGGTRVNLAPLRPDIWPRASSAGALAASISAPSALALGLLSGPPGAPPSTSFVAAEVPAPDARQKSYTIPGVRVPSPQQPPSGDGNVLLPPVNPSGLYRRQQGSVRGGSAGGVPSAAIDSASAGNDASNTPPAAGQHVYQGIGSYSHQSLSPHNPPLLPMADSYDQAPLSGGTPPVMPYTTAPHLRSLSHRTIHVPQSPIGGPAGYGALGGQPGALQGSVGGCRHHSLTGIGVGGPSMGSASGPGGHGIGGGTTETYDADAGHQSSDAGIVSRLVMTNRHSGNAVCSPLLPRLQSSTPPTGLLTSKSIAGVGTVTAAATAAAALAAAAAAATACTSASSGSPLAGGRRHTGSNSQPSSARVSRTPSYNNAATSSTSVTFGVGAGGDDGVGGDGSEDPWVATELEEGLHAASGICYYVPLDEKPPTPPAHANSSTSLPPLHPTQSQGQGQMLGPVMSGCGGGGARPTSPAPSTAAATMTPSGQRDGLAVAPPPAMSAGLGGLMADIRRWKLERGRHRAGLAPGRLNTAAGRGSPPQQQGLGRNNPT